MIQCQASWLAEADLEGPWPSGNWQSCQNEGSKVQFVPVNDQVMVMVHMCPAHEELWRSAGKVARIFMGPTVAEP